MITKLTRVFGKEVFTIQGSKVGRVVDVAIDVDTRRVSDLFISNLDAGFSKKFDLDGKKGIIFSYSGIKNISDIVLVSEMRPPIKESEAAAPEEHKGGLLEE